MCCLLKATQGRQHKKTVGGSVQGVGEEGKDIEEEKRGGREGERGMENENLKKRFFKQYLTFTACFAIFCSSEVWSQSSNLNVWENNLC